MRPPPRRRPGRGTDARRCRRPADGGDIGRRHRLRHHRPGPGQGRGVLRPVGPGQTEAAAAALRRTRAAGARRHQPAPLHLWPVAGFRRHGLRPCADRYQQARLSASGDRAGRPRGRRHRGHDLDRRRSGDAERIGRGRSRQQVSRQRGFPHPGEKTPRQPRSDGRCRSDRRGRCRRLEHRSPPARLRLCLCAADLQPRPVRRRHPAAALHGARAQAVRSEDRPDRLVGQSGAGAARLPDRGARAGGRCLGDRRSGGDRRGQYLRRAGAAGRRRHRAALPRQRRYRGQCPPRRHHRRDPLGHGRGAGLFLRPFRRPCRGADGGDRCQPHAGRGRCPRAGGGAYPILAPRCLQHGARGLCQRLQPLPAGGLPGGALRRRHCRGSGRGDRRGPDPALHHRCADGAAPGQDPPAAGAPADPGAFSGQAVGPGDPGP